MLKQKTIDIADSNIAGLGTELEKKVRLEAAATEKAWANIGKKCELRVWRIEKFKVVPWPEEKYGQFFSGDSYIVLNTYQKPDEPKFYHDIHFWLGLKTSQDEAGTAAYKTVECDDFLHGDPVEHREVQGAESPLFLSYFKHLIIMEGGVDSGFRHVEPEKYTPRLMWIKDAGHNNLAVREVPISYKSLNSGDVFLYDGGVQLYQWNGGKSSGSERSKAAELVRAIIAERKGKAKVEVFNEGDKDAAPFWKAIGGEGPVKSQAEGDKEASSEASKPREKVLIRVSDASGKLTKTEIARGTVKRSLIDSNDVFIFDIGKSVYVYVGKKASPQEKKTALNVAMEYLKEAKLPLTTHISRVLEGSDCPEFDEAFDGAPKATHIGGKPLVNGRAAHK